MYIEIARLRPSTTGSTRSSPPSFTQRRRTGSLQTSAPAATVTALFPSKVTRVLVPATTTPANDCRPMSTFPKVIGFGPQVLVRRTPCCPSRCSAARSSRARPLLLRVIAIVVGARRAAERGDGEDDERQLGQGRAQGSFTV